MQSFGQEMPSKRPFVRPISRQKYNIIKMDLQESWCESVDWLGSGDGLLWMLWWSSSI